MRLDIAIHFDYWRFYLASHWLGSTVMSFEMSQLICRCRSTDIAVGQQSARGRPHSDPGRELALFLPPSGRSFAAPHRYDSPSFGLHLRSLLVPGLAQRHQGSIASIPSSDFINLNFFGAEFT